MTSDAFKIISRAPDLAQLARDEDLAFIAAPRAVVDSMHHWTEIRVEDDPRHPRLRRLVLRGVTQRGAPDPRRHRMEVKS